MYIKHVVLSIILQSSTCTYFKTIYVHSNPTWKNIFDYMNIVWSCMMQKKKLNSGLQICLQIFSSSEQHVHNFPPYCTELFIFKIPEKCLFHPRVPAHPPPPKNKPRVCLVAFLLLPQLRLSYLLPRRWNFCLVILQQAAAAVQTHPYYTAK